MSENLTSEKYPAALRVLHWLVALMIIGLLAAGLIMTGMSHDNPNRSLVYALHKSFGLTVLALAILRVALRLTLGAPALPLSIPRLERILAHLGHLALYGFMFALPLSGYVMTSSFGLTVKWFGLALPKWLNVDRTRGQWAGYIHTYGAYALIGMILLHAGAVLLHYRKERINLLKRML